MQFLRCSLSLFVSCITSKENIIHCVFLKHDERLWMCTKLGFCFAKYKTNLFIQIFLLFLSPLLYEQKMLKIFSCMPFVKSKVHREIMWLNIFDPKVLLIVCGHWCIHTTAANKLLSFLQAIIKSDSDPFHVLWKRFAFLFISCRNTFIQIFCTGDIFCNLAKDFWAYIFVKFLRLVMLFKFLMPDLSQVK